MYLSTSTNYTGFNTVFEAVLPTDREILWFSRQDWDLVNHRSLILSIFKVKIERVIVEKTILNRVTYSK